MMSTNQYGYCGPLKKSYLSSCATVIADSESQTELAATFFQLSLCAHIESEIQNLPGRGGSKQSVLSHNMASSCPLKSLKFTEQCHKTASHLFW
jgi:hypothetical protein